MENQSEVTQLLALINREYDAARQGLSGLAQGVSRHKFMTKRTERIAELHTQLCDLVGDEAAMILTAEPVEQSDQASV